MDLRELLAKADAPEDLVFTGADGTTFKLADLRGTVRSSVDSERAELNRRIKEATDLSNTAKTISEGFEAAIKEAQANAQPRTPEAKKSDWRKNPLYEELIPVIEGLEGIAKAAQTEAAQNKKNLDLATATYAAERLRRQWAEAKVKPKDAKFEEVVAQVLANKEVDELGMPTLDKYLYRATEQDRLDAYAAEKVAAERKKWDADSKMAAHSKPTGKFSTIKAETGKAPIKNLDELNSGAIEKAIQTDPDFAAAMENVQ